MTSVTNNSSLTQTITQDELLSRGAGGGILSLVNFRLVCAAKGLKPWHFLGIKDMKIDTLFKSQTQKWHPTQGKNNN